MIVIDACLYCSTSSSSPSVCQDAGHGMDMDNIMECMEYGCWIRPDLYGSSSTVRDGG